MRKRNLHVSIAALTAALVFALLFAGCDLIEDPEPANVRSYSFMVNRDQGALANATVSILTGRGAYAQTTDGNGHCEINIPNTIDLPDFVIATIDHDDIRPGAVALSGSFNSNSSKVVNCRRLPSVVLVKETPLHHLGNDQYGGAANSKHQLPTEGIQLSFGFQLAGIPHTMPHLQLYIRGVEHPTEIIINGIRTDRLANSAPNGDLSYLDAQLTANPNTVFRRGYNTLTIKTGANTASDPWDDIEFCGLLLYYP